MAELRDLSRKQRPQEDPDPDRTREFSEDHGLQDESSAPVLKGGRLTGRSLFLRQVTMCVGLVALMCIVSAVMFSIQHRQPPSIVGIRGATTAESNTVEAIHDATYELVMEILRQNDLEPADVTEAQFTVTPDLNAAFAATPARTRIGVTAPLFGGVEAEVDGSASKCIRVLLHARSKVPQGDVQFVYLRGAATLQSSVPGGSSGSGASEVSLDQAYAGTVGQGVGAGDAGKSTLDRIRRRGSLIVGSPGDYPPYSLLCSHSSSGAFCDGEDWGGADIEMVEGLASVLGVEVRLVKTSWATLVDDMVSKATFDIAVGGVSDTAQRRLSVFFSTPYSHSGKTAVVRCDSPLMATLATPAALNRAGLVIGVNPGGTNHKFVLQHAPNASVRLIEQGSQGEVLMQEQVQVVITDTVEAQLMAAWFGEALCAVSAQGWTREAKAIALPRGDMSLKLFVDGWLSENEAAIADSLSRWTGAAAAHGPFDP